ncbi:hypothetical protein A4G19_06965 [Pasteurellaceae bacterium Macca]|nr:hypothetical protein [Pasteurellaceae bacterium Macca]
MPAFIFLFGVFFYIYCEISLLVSVGSAIGVLPLMLLMIGISVVGLWLIKLQGIMTVMQIRSQLSQGQIPTQAVSSAFFFALAGVLLFIPGFLSDILALLLVFPFTRQILQKFALRFFASKMKFTTFQQQSNHNTTFEAEFERQADEDKRLK